MYFFMIQDCKRQLGGLTVLGMGSMVSEIIDNDDSKVDSAPEDGTDGTGDGNIVTFKWMNIITWWFVYINYSVHVHYTLIILNFSQLI